MGFIFNLIFFLGLLSGVVNSRSTTVKSKMHNAPIGFIPDGQRPLSLIMSFIGGPIAIIAISIWGFLNIKWYLVILSWFVCGAICRFIVEKKFNFPLDLITLFYSDIFTTLCAISLWVSYFFLF
ncbi:hypothetical protein N9U83_05145 [Candidatus Pelagibacter sp.]|jgi:hypothetical protein|nr:hypothetical protein [Candidatus Pelagibacter sp.]